MVPNLYHMHCRLPTFVFGSIIWVLLFVPQELAAAFEDDAKENRKTRLMLSANVAALRQTIIKAYEVDKIAR